MRTIYPSIHILCYLLRIKFVGWSCNIPSLRNLCACTTFIMTLYPLFPWFFFLQDIELSKEINESFKQSSQARTKLPSGIEMSVHVLTTGYVLCIKLRHICKHLLTFRVWCRYWPTYPPMDVKLPHELNVYQVFTRSSNMHPWWFFVTKFFLSF